MCERCVGIYAWSYHYLTLKCRTLLRLLFYVMCCRFRVALPPFAPEMLPLFCYCFHLAVMHVLSVRLNACYRGLMLGLERMRLGGWLLVRCQMFGSINWFNAERLRVDCSVHPSALLAYKRYNVMSLWDAILNALNSLKPLRVGCIFGDVFGLLISLAQTLLPKAPNSFAAKTQWPSQQ